MGYDLNGRDPSGVDGEYLQVNVEDWPLYLNLIRPTGLFGDIEMEQMRYNDGFLVTDMKAQQLAAALKSVQPTLPETPSNYALSQNRLQRFIAFLEASGGFRIW